MICAPKNFKNPARLFNPSVRLHDGHVSNMRALRVVGIPSVSPSVIYVGTPSEISSMMVAHSRNFFSTLCEIPTGYIPSVIMAHSGNFFELSVKYRRVIVRRRLRRWWWHTPVIIFQLSVKYRRVIVRRWNRKFFLFFLCNRVTKSWIAILQHTQHNNKSWPIKKNKYFMFQILTL